VEQEVHEVYVLKEEEAWNPKALVRDFEFYMGSNSSLYRTTPLLILLRT
jgi:hypothetical protein